CRAFTHAAETPSRSATCFALTRCSAIDSLLRVERIEEDSLMLVGVRSQVPVRGVNHCERRSHPSREREERDARSKRPGRVCVAQVVDPAMRDAGGPKGRLPVALAPLAELDMAASDGREEE